MFILIWIKILCSIEEANHSFFLRYCHGKKKIRMCHQQRSSMWALGCHLRYLYILSPMVANFLNRYRYYHMYAMLNSFPCRSQRFCFQCYFRTKVNKVKIEGIQKGPPPTRFSPVTSTNVGNQFARIHTTSLIKIEKILDRPITKFYKSDDVNVTAAELRLTKTRPASIDKKHNLS